MSETLTPVKGMWYSGKRLKLDGYWFTDCRFDNCVLVYDRPDFAISRCLFGEGTRVLHSIGGERAIQLFHALPPKEGDDASALKPVYDGNLVTIDYHFDALAVLTGANDG